MLREKIILSKKRGEIMPLDGTHEVKSCSPCNFRGIAYFYDFFGRCTVELYAKNFAQANKPYAVG